MTSGVAQVRFGDVLTPVSRVERLAPETSYRTVGVKWYAQGLFHREPLLGQDIKAKVLYKVATGDLVYNRLFAWKGSFALADAEHDGCLVSGEFPCFTIDPEKVNPAYVRWYTATPSFWNSVVDLSTGSSRQSRLRLKEERFLEMRMPLPPRREQDRIVEVVRSVSGRISEAQRLRESVDKERDEMLWTMAHGGAATDKDKERMGWARVTLADVMQPGAAPCRVEKDKRYPSIGMFSFGRGAFHKPPVDGADLKSTTLYRVKAGQFIYAKLCAFEGTFGVVPDDADGAFVSNEFPAFDCDPDRVSSVFLFCYFKAPHIWDELDKAIRGFGGRRFRLKPEHLLAYKVWLPPRDYQNAVEQVYRHVERLRETQTTVAKELDDVMPALLDRAFRGEI